MSRADPPTAPTAIETVGTAVLDVDDGCEVWCLVWVWVWPNTTAAKRVAQLSKDRGSIMQIFVCRVCVQQGRSTAPSVQRESNCEVDRARGREGVGCATRRGGNGIPANK